MSLMEKRIFAMLFRSCRPDPRSGLYRRHDRHHMPQILISGPPPTGAEPFRQRARIAAVATRDTDIYLLRFTKSECRPDRKHGVHNVLHTQPSPRISNTG